MSDYPQVVAGIHKRVLDNLIAEGQLSGNASIDSMLRDSHFTVEELEMIQKGYKLLAEEEAEEEIEDQILAGLGYRAATGPQGAGKGNLLFMSRTSIHIGYSFFANNLIPYHVDASASEHVPNPPPVRDPEPDKSPEPSHKTGKEPRDPFQP